MVSFSFFGAGDGIRTCDLLITNQLHYRLCYTSDCNIISHSNAFFKSFLNFYFIFIMRFYRFPLDYFPII